MRSALLVHYCGDIAACIRYVGGLLFGHPYQAASLILPRIQPIVDALPLLALPKSMPTSPAPR